MTTDLATIEAALAAAGNPGQDDWYNEAALAESNYIHDSDFQILLHAPVWLAELVERVRTAEAEVERLAGPWPCCSHCAEDPIHDIGPRGHEIPCVHCQDYRGRAEAAEAAIDRVRRACEGKRRWGETDSLIWMHEVFAALDPNPAQEGPEHAE
jgi:hypothetical protein